ncbi:MAG: hypothetical protein IPL50_00945 [Chitinophagaceae bacterium]|nr:hypothetical protein [Chitinophagaceae bacterium]
MKQFITAHVKKTCNRAAMIFAMTLFSLIGFAQEKKVEIDINTKPDNGGNFFTQYWVWIVVGGAVFILLLVALLRNNSSKN